MTTFRMATWVNPSYKGSWVDRHRAAVFAPSAAELPLVLLLRGWCIYVVEYDKRYDGNVGSDRILGPHWAEIGYAMRGMLNGECGRLDAGTMDGIIFHNLVQAGFTPE